MELSIPDRFEILAQDTQALDTIIVPVDEALKVVDSSYADIRTAGRGGFMLLRGNAGVGKTTFLQTLNLFRENVETDSISGDTDLREGLREVRPSKAGLRVLVVEGREALGDTTTEQLETALHQINSFLRQPRGRNTLVVWPCNTDTLQERIVSLATQIGADALRGPSGPVYIYRGPHKDQFRHIAQVTIATLNNGASFPDLGISEDDLRPLIQSAVTVGSMLGEIRRLAIQNRDNIASLIAKEQCRLWILVAAGNEPSGEVAGLTRGSNSFVDIDRLMGATEANIVQQIKQHPARMGIVASGLDARIFHLPSLAALSVVRSFSDKALKEKMQALKLSISEDRPDALARLERTDLATAFLGERQGLTRTRKGLGPNTTKAFESLSKIAENNDGMLNTAVGNALQAAGFIENFVTEKNLGTGMTRNTDVVAETKLGRIRIEVMWRKRTSRAEIANYTLTKIWQYGQALGAI